VFYLTKRDLTERKVAQITKEVQPNAVFLNSALSTPTIRLLSARRKGSIGEIPVIIAPCGELSSGALSLKPYKKRLFLTYAKAVELYRGVIWKASFNLEEAEIRSIMGNAAEVLIAPDLAPKTILSEYTPEWKDQKEPGSVRFVFLSRLSRKKNIHYFLERLRGIKNGDVRLDIVGPLEDQVYWKQCLSIIEELPERITVKATGAIPDQHDALRRVAEGHFFVLPTLNENFGYVFLEGLAAGCPLLTSDRTVWTDIEEQNAGWRIPLEDEDAWVNRIKSCIRMGESEYATMAVNAREYALNWLAQTEVEHANERVLQLAVNNKARVTSNE
jgi:glycosyltransferase involved in cell wall biosynthesis